MKHSRLDKIIKRIEEDYGDRIRADASDYLEVDIGKLAHGLGCPLEGETYRKVSAIIPLRAPARGMKVRIDGRTFVDYAQYDSGVVVPGYVAKAAGLPFKAYTAAESMVLNF